MRILDSRSILEQPTRRLDALTGLRWWAAFMVFLYHMLVFAPLPGVISTVFAQGYFGVTFFFVLSGFVLTWSARPALRVSTFYWRRFARIWPAHMVALLFAIPVFYTLGAIPEGSFLKPFDLGILLLSVVLLQAWSSTPAILFSGNPAAWTLTCEAFFYALHPWISRFLQRFAQRGALLFAAVVVMCAFLFRGGVVLFPTSVLAAVPVPVVRVSEFILGMALAWAIRAGWRVRISPILGIGSMFAVVATIAVVSRTGIDIPVIRLIPAFGNELFTVACAVAIVSLAQHALSGRRSMLEMPLQVKLGEWSFAFYLVHATVIYLALRIFGLQEASWWNIGWFAVIFAIDLVLAWALHAFVERPMERRMRAWKDRRDQRRLQAADRASAARSAAVRDPA